MKKGYRQGMKSSRLIKEWGYNEPAYFSVTGLLKRK